MSSIVKRLTTTDLEQQQRTAVKSGFLTLGCLFVALSSVFQMLNLFPFKPFPDSPRYHLALLLIASCAAAAALVSFVRTKAHWIAIFRAEQRAAESGGRLHRRRQAVLRFRDTRSETQAMRITPSGEGKFDLLDLISLGLTGDVVTNADDVISNALEGRDSQLGELVGVMPLETMRVMMWAVLGTTMMRYLETRTGVVEKHDGEDLGDLYYVLGGTITMAMGLLSATLRAIGLPDMPTQQISRSKILRVPDEPVRQWLELPAPLSTDADRKQFLRKRLPTLLSDICSIAKEIGEKSTDAHREWIDMGITPQALLQAIRNVEPKDGRRGSMRTRRPESYALKWLGPSPAAGKQVAAKASAAPSPTVAPSKETLEAAVLPWRERVASLDQQVQQLTGELRAQKTLVGEDRLSTQLQDALHGLRARVHWLESRVVAATSIEKAQEPPSKPTTWAELWAHSERHFAGRLVLTRKAMRAAESSVFRDIGFAADVLQLLAGPYTAMRRAEEGSRAQFEQAIAELGVDIGPTGETIYQHRYKAAYQVTYLGRQLLLDMHCQGSNSRKRTEGFRLYFCYQTSDDGLGYVVVGHLPSHLESRQS